MVKVWEDGPIGDALRFAGDVFDDCNSFKGNVKLLRLEGAEKWRAGK